MAVFYREHFKTGFMIIEDQDAEGNIVKKMVKSKDNGKDILVKNEVFVKGKYIGWLHKDKAAMEEAKAASKLAKENARKSRGSEGNASDTLAVVPFNETSRI